jgi:hypothetical protein
MGRDIGLRRLDTEKSTNTDLLSVHVSEAFQHVFSKRRLNGLGDFGVVPDRPRQDVVVADAVLDLFHQSDRLALNDLT